VEDPRSNRVDEWKRIVRLFAPEVRSFRRSIVAAFFLGLLLVATDLGLALTIRAGLDSIARSGDLPRTLRTTATLAALFGAKVYLTWRYAILRGTMSHGIWINLQKRLFTLILSLDLRFFIRLRGGDFASRALVDTQSVYPVLTMLIHNASRDLPTFAILSVVLYVYNPLFLLIVVIAAPLLLGWQTRRVNKVEEIGRQAAAQRGEVMSHFLERLRGLVTIRSFGTESREADGYNDRLHVLQRMLVRLEALQAVVVTSNEAFAAGTILLVLLTGYYQIQAHHISFGTFGLTFAVIGFLYRPIQSMAGSYAIVRKNLGSISRILDVFHWPAVPASGDPEPSPAPFRHDIQLANAVFRYEDRAVLRGANLTIRKGQTVMVTGRNGSGKSTLGLILAGLFPLESGDHRLDGESVNDLPPAALRRLVAYVGQDTILFNMTVEENLLYGAAGDVADLSRWIEEFDCTDIIDRLPRKLQTVVGEAGSQLSTGEKQRLSLLRALIRQPEVLILDEITSNIDQGSRARISAMLAKQRALGRTIVLFTHQHADFPFADQTYALEDGLLRQA
jgi:ATP-binding cassette subfamily B protein